MEKIKKIDFGLYRKLKILNKVNHLRSILGSQLKRNRHYRFNCLPYLLREIVYLLDYLGISFKEFNSLYQKWDTYVSEFGKFENPQDFYLSWTNEMGRSNLCANLVNQVIPYTALYSYIISEFGNRSVDYCDYGCGTGTFSFIVNQRASLKTVHLYDVQNAAADYIDFRIKTGGLENFKWFNVLDKRKTHFKYDLIICLDVLEHLQDSSRVFIKISGMLKRGGVLILRTPWGNYPEHIPEAAVNFYREEGYVYLRKKYKLIHHFGNFHIHGAYKKIE